MHSIQWLVVSSQPKDSINITFWFILGMVSSALIWFCYVRGVSLLQLHSIEKFINEEFENNRNNVRKILDSSNKRTKIRMQENVYDLKQFGKEYLPKYRDLLFSLCPCKINKRLEKYSEWSSQYEMLEQLIALSQESPTTTKENKERMDILCSLLLKKSG